LKDIIPGLRHDDVIASEQKKPVKTEGKTGQFVVNCPLLGRHPKRRLTPPKLTAGENLLSLRDLNWRKGFFRLWLMASLIWIVVYAALEVYPATMHFIESVKAEGQLVIIKKEIDTLPDTSGATPETAPKGEPHILSSPEEMEAFLSTPEMAAKVSQLRALMQYNDTMDIAALKKSRGEHLIFCSAMTFLPPLIVLAIGKSLMWVFLGFFQNQRG
jgi:hypothetical protein